METNNNEETKTGKSFSLHDALNEATETKEPSKSNKAFEYNFDAEPEEETNNTPYNNQSTQKQTTAQKPVITDKDKEKNQQASAETLTSMLDTCFDMAGSLYLSNRFKKQFTDDQWERAKELQFKPKESLTDPEEIALQNKFNRLNKKREEKLAQLPFEESATERMNRIFYNYFKVTGKEMSPEIMLYMGVGVALMEKANTIFFD